MSPRSLRATVWIGALLLAGSGCASLEFTPKDESQGTFVSTAWTFTFLSTDLPGPALSVARANAADSGRSNLVIRHESLVPYLGPLDWLLDILCIRYARVTGTFGDTER